VVMSGVRDFIHPSRQPMPIHFNSSLRKTIGEDCLHILVVGFWHPHPVSAGVFEC
jgi:hypothetical protein